MFVLLWLIFSKLLQHCNVLTKYSEITVALTLSADSSSLTVILKDTITNNSKFDFGEEVYKEINKQAHLRRDRKAKSDSLVIRTYLSGKENQQIRYAPTRPTVTPIANIIIHRIASYFLAF